MKNKVTREIKKIEEAFKGFSLPEDGRTDGHTEITPCVPAVFYRTSSPSDPLPCINFSNEKRRPMARNGQQYPLLSYPSPLFFSRPSIGR